MGSPASVAFAKNWSTLSISRMIASRYIAQPFQDTEHDVSGLLLSFVESFEIALVLLLTMLELLPVMLVLAVASV